MVVKSILEMKKKKKEKQEMQEKQLEQAKQGKSKAARKIAVGAGIITATGIAIGLLFATNKGKEIREDVSTKAKQNLGTLKDVLVNTKGYVKNHLKDTVKGFYNGIKQFGQKVEKTEEEVVESINEVTEE